MVRIESANDLCGLSPNVFLSPLGLIETLRRHVAGKCSPDETSRLQEWLQDLNHKRDARPAFVAPFGEVRDIIEQNDWASKLRDMLGLASFAGTPTKPMSVVPCRDSLKRAEAAERLQRVCSPFRQ